jgi:hypothetical protein
MSATTVCKTEPTGEQTPARIAAAQDVLKQLQLALQEGELPGPEAINDALVKAEQFLVKHTKDIKLKTDPQTLQVMEDIVLLVGSAKNMSRHKHLAERLQIIAEETKKALVEAAKAGVSVPTLKASYEAASFIDTWRPLYQLLVT